MARTFPHKDARTIFVCAEDFSRAVSAMRRGKTRIFDTRSMGPQTVCAVLAAELYLKCIIADCTGAFPGVHDLLQLFEAIPPKERNQILLDWRKRRKSWAIFFPNKPKLKGLRLILKLHAKSFENWRYRFQRTRKELPDRYVLDHINLALSDFLISRHPAWQRDAEAHFLATFPAP